ncbi:MAG: hypothetical protein K2N82_15675, partial [Lachnospiraceae bacterium]|nr:hypothetical protein [Lachnospiraceae bacterium]
CQADLFKIIAKIAEELSDRILFLCHTTGICFFSHIKNPSRLCISITSNMIYNTENARFPGILPNILY